MVNILGGIIYYYDVAVLLPSNVYPDTNNDQKEKNR